ncbi:MAG: RNA polymerase sigma factor [Gammaproteobacteria bacterium]
MARFQCDVFDPFVELYSILGSDVSRRQRQRHSQGRQRSSPDECDYRYRRWSREGESKWAVGIDPDLAAARRKRYCEAWPGDARLSARRTNFLRRGIRFREIRSISSGALRSREDASRGEDWREEDTHAFVEELAGSHSERLRRFLRTRVRNSADIPDIIQEVFLRLLRFPTTRPSGAPEAYIFTVAHHVAQQHTLRSAASAGSIELSEVLSELQAVVEADPALEVTAGQCLEQLDDALAELSPKIRRLSCSTGAMACRWTRSASGSAFPAPWPRNTWSRRSHTSVSG